MGIVDVDEEGKTIAKYKGARYKRFSCDACHDVSEVLDACAWVPNGWLRLQIKEEQDRVWSTYSYICAKCAKSISSDKFLKWVRECTQKVGER